MTKEKRNILSLCKKAYDDQSGYTKVFLLCILAACVTIGPFIVRGHGILTIVNDFNYQQLPFYMISNAAIKSGDVFWSWYNDLGSDFIGGYSFYTLGSPFFWLSLLFPVSSVPYLMGPLLILKYGVAGLTSYAYMQRFLKNKNYAVIGALFYAFSGFQTGNLMFNHFHDVVALFPLLLIGLEEIVESKKFGYFALAVGLNALVNFFFFIGEVFFIALYFCMRWLVPNFKRNVRFLFKCLFEGVLGVGLASLLFIPSILFTLNNPRTGRFMYGVVALFHDPNRYLALLKAVLLPADIMPDPVTTYATGYSSCFAYLPLVGISLVLVYLFKYKRDWLPRMLKACILIACVPILNSIFYGLNESYYARWFYMPILLFSLASALVMEKRKELSIRRGMLWTGGLLVLLVLVSCFYPWAREIKRAAVHSKLFGVYALAALGGLAITGFLLTRKFSDKRVYSLMLVFVLLSAVSLGMVNIYKQQQLKWESQNPAAITNTVVKNGLNLYLPDAQENYRVSLDLDYYNFAMINQTPSINSFTSTVSGSVYEFYNALGEPRNVISKPTGEVVRALLSVKYDVTSNKLESRKLVASYYDGTRTTYVYERFDFIPLGFTYDYYLEEDRFLKLPASIRSEALLKAIVLSEEQIALGVAGLKSLPEEELGRTTVEDWKEDIAQRKKEASLAFHRYSTGFDATLFASSDKFAFFSVPYDSSWSASVNGKKVPIMNSAGMMVIPVKEGKNEIKFTYSSIGLKWGIRISLFSLLVLIAYMAAFIRKRNILR